ncbi:MAG: UDP-N-acetylglucosamine pyrophosphorylase/glucosamine-phosphate N-acetyltransferase [Chthonomonadaceae bacterium]|nr:UDP-N-acetylglucosamine pyrophosphorylase/glucosamine-phosphate N-acetyltransferase [Chthonomonadaceae bacterium]
MPEELNAAAKSPAAPLSSVSTPLPAPEEGTPPVAAIILAAGKSTRMQSRLPKMLHPLCGIPMTAHVIRACRAAGVARIVVVIGHASDEVRAGLGEEVEYAYQANQQGTGDAVRSAYPLLSDWPGTILALAGDVPLLAPESLRELILLQQHCEAVAALLTARLDDPTGYGRILRNVEGQVIGIVEQKNATPEQKAIKEWNPSIYAFHGPALWSALERVERNPLTGEFYLTDTIGLLAAQQGRIEGLLLPDAQDALGVNNRVELAQAATILRDRLLRTLMLAGVTVTDPANTYVDVDVEVGQDTVLEPNTFLHLGTRIGKNGRIGPMTRIEKSTLGDDVQVVSSQIVGSVLEDRVKVGPFANLRPGTHLGPDVKIGDFVETKNAVFGARAQASHLSYIGDAEVGAGTNIGAGAITCNYDGYRKSRTVIGKNAFIGSNSTLIAPVTIGDGAFVAAASSVPSDVPEDALLISRPLPTIKEGWAARNREQKAPGVPPSAKS